jgi:uncharacterized protein (UPF0303 family)
MPAALARAALVIGVVAGLAGCSGMAETIDAAAKDQNPVCIDMTVYGSTLHYNRLHGCDRP